MGNNQNAREINEPPSSLRLLKKKISCNLFKIPLEELYQHHRAVLPAIDKCLRYFESKAHLFTAELFTSQGEVLTNELQMLINYVETAGDEIGEQALIAYTPEAVCYFFKRFFEKLPDPLLTYRHYNTFVGAMKRLEDVYPACSLKPDYFDRLQFLKALIITLPRGHYVFLERIMRSFSDICRNANNTHIDSVKLGGIFAGTFLRPRRKGIFSRKGKTNEAQKKLDILGEQQCISFIIDNYDAIFRQNPARELNFVAQKGVTMKSHLEDQDDLLRRLEQEKISIKNHAATRQFQKRIVLRHFLAWRGLTPSAKEQITRFAKLADLQTKFAREREARIHLQAQLDETHKHIQLSFPAMGESLSRHLSTFQRAQTLPLKSLPDSPYAVSSPGPTYTKAEARSPYLRTLSAASSPRASGSRTMWN